MAFGTFSSGMSGAEGLALGRMAAEASASNAALARRLFGPKPVDVDALQRELTRLSALVVEQDKYITHINAQLAERDCQIARQRAQLAEQEEHHARRISHIDADLRNQLAEQEESYERLSARATGYERKIEIMEERIVATFKHYPVAP